MNKVKDKLPALVDEELEAAMEEHPLFSSAHEGYAVLLEEIEEAEEALYQLRENVGTLWGAVRRDNVDMIKGKATQMARSAIDLAAEAIQVAAMARKLRTSLRRSEAR